MELEEAINICTDENGNPPTKEELAEYLDVSVRTVERRIKGKYYIDKNDNRVRKT